MRIANLFWGVLFIALGILFFLSNLGFISVDWGFIIDLWPLLIVFLGIYFLPNKLSNLLTILLLLVMIGLMITAINSVSFDLPGESRSLDRDNDPIFNFNNGNSNISVAYKERLDYAKLFFKTDSGRFELEGSTDHLFTLEAEETPWKSFNLNQHSVGDTSTIDLTLNGINPNSKLENPIKLNFNPEPFWMLYLDMGSSKANLDLTPFKVREIKLKAEKADLNFRLGDEQKNSTLKIQAPRSKITIEIPEETGCRISGANRASLKEANFENFTKHGPNTLISENFNGSEHKVLISLKSSLEKFNIERD